MINRQELKSLYDIVTKNDEKLFSTWSSFESKSDGVTYVYDKQNRVVAYMPTDVYLDIVKYNDSK